MFKKILSILCISLFTASLAYGAQVKVVWNSVENADGYKVYWGTESGIYPNIINESGINNTDWTHEFGEGTYYLALTAYNEFGESTFSEEKTFTILSQGPPVAGDLSATVDGTSIIATWAYPDQTCEISSQIITLDGETEITLAPDVLTYTFADLASGSHTIVVSSINEFGTTISNTISATIEEILLPPTGFSGTIIYRWENGCLKTVVVE